MLKEIPGYSLQFASTDGLIYSMRTGTLVKKSMRLHNGYYRVNLRDGSFPAKNCTIPVHKLILDTFVGLRPEGYVCRHLNGNPLDNRLENICWGTPKENAQDALRHGTSVCLRCGEESIRAKLSNKDVSNIRELYARGYSRSELAKMYNISWRHTADIISMRTRVFG